MRAADLLVGALAKARVEVIFSLSGNQIMPIYDACIDAGIRIIHTRHEGGAVYMAEAYAQATGKPGIALVTAGPGFTSSLGPLYSARAAESPVVLISGYDRVHALEAFDTDGISSFLRKPFEVEALRSRVRDLIRAS